MNLSGSDLPTRRRQIPRNALSAASSSLCLRRRLTGSPSVFDHPVIGRCQLHKLRNVTDKLPDALAKAVARARGNSALCSR